MLVWITLFPGAGLITLFPGVWFDYFVSWFPGLITVSWCWFDYFVSGFPGLITPGASFSGFLV